MITLSESVLIISFIKRDNTIIFISR